MASIQSRTGKRGNTTWRLMFRRGGRQESITFPSQAEAERWRRTVDLIGPESALALLAAEVSDDPAPAAPIPTVREVVEHHIDHLSGVTNGTRINYRREAERDILPPLGALPVDQVTRDVVATWVNQLGSPGRLLRGRPARPLSAKSVRNRHALLSSALASAVARGVIPANPAAGLRLPQISGEDVCFLTQQQWWVVHDSLPAAWRPLATVLVGTGLRWGEATALQPRDIDLDAGRLRVARAWKVDGGNARVIGGPKSSAGWRRTVPLSPEVVAVIDPLMRRPAEAWLFTNARGGPVRNATFHGSVWSPARRSVLAAGQLERWPRLHDLRHTFASWALAAGTVNIFTLSKVLGHESPVVTQRVYGHLLEANLAAIASATGERLTRPARSAA